VSLEDAEAAEDAGARLALLLEAWRAKRSAEVRELVIAASARALLARPPGTRRILAKEWDELEARGLPADLPRLLDSIRFETPTEGLRRFQKLLQRPEDPRLGDEIVGWFASPPCARRTPASVHFWDVVATRIPMNDPALGPKLAAVKTGGSSSAQRSWLANTARRLAKTLVATAPALTPEEAAVVSRLRALLASEAQAAGKKAAEGARSEQELLEAVYAAPDDDGPRLVYADWLQERGDPWGELIVLQLAKNEGKPAKAANARMREIVEKHARARLEGLPLELDSVMIARGFPDRAVVISDTTVDRRNSDPRWRTFRELAFPYWYDAGIALDMLADPVKRSLRRIIVRTEIAGALVARLSPLPFEVEFLGVHPGTMPLPDVLDAIATTGSPSFQKLQTLRIDYPPRGFWDELLGRPIERKVRRLELASGSRLPWRIARERTESGSRLELVVTGRIQQTQYAALEQDLRDASRGATETAVTSTKPLGKKTAALYRGILAKVVPK
jgi:uncharacterized protein (TIGR02996 family)